MQETFPRLLPRSLHATEMKNENQGYYNTARWHKSFPRAHQEEVPKDS